MSSHHTNVVRIRVLSRLLGEMSDEVVFVGGATVSLYATDPTAEEVRPTDDVDILVELATYRDYAKLEGNL